MIRRLSLLSLLTLSDSLLPPTAPARATTALHAGGGVSVLQRKAIEAQAKKFREGLEAGDPIKVALDAASGSVAPGEMACMLGPSGAGKTTLLSILGARPQLGAGGSWTGRVLVNGAAPRTLWLRDLGFVMQRDIFFDTLTVGQELAFAAATRLPRSWTPEKRRQRAAEVAAQLGLTSVLPSKIGSAVERGLSGGEVKRLNICVELLNDPRLLLLDEPLTGLDSSRAFSVLEALRARATAGHRAILLSVHQPTSKLWLLFDKLVLMAPGGRVAYEGSALDAEAFFESCGLPLPGPGPQRIRCARAAGTGCSRGAFCAAGRAGTFCIGRGWFCLVEEMRLKAPEATLNVGFEQLA